MNDQKVKIIEIPVLERKHPDFFLIQVRLQLFISMIYDNPEEKSCYSFRDYSKQKMKWPKYVHLFGQGEVKNKA